jgi:N-methylhydantoinase A
MLAGGKLAGGIAFDNELARAAFAPLGKALRFEIEDVARGVLTIVNANMANTIREITIEQGHDPRQAKLVAFGGAGPLFATLLARELEIREIVVPLYVGNFSAWGLLGADLRRTAALTRVMQLGPEAVEEANVMLERLFAELDARAAGGIDSGSSREAALDMRYVGQEHTLTVAVEMSSGSIAQGSESIRTAFTRDYLRTFGLTMDEEMQIVSVRATARTSLSRRGQTEIWASDSRGMPRSLPAYSFTRDEWTDFAVLERSSLAVDTAIDGPAIILEETGTTYLDVEFTARVHRSGCMFISDMGGS